ncbi:MAG: formate dehydrogenase subunit delta [Candidatus Rariloculaceae bacterium]
MSDNEQPAVTGAVIDMEQLISMANQIGDFYSPYPPERAQEGFRNHLRTNWDPRMRSALLEHIDAGGEGLDDCVIDSAQLLRDEAAQKSGYYGPPKA